MQLTTESSSAAHQRQFQNLCLAVIATVVAGFALYFLKSVVLPFVLAIFFVCGIDPILTTIQSWRKVPRSLAVGITFGIGLMLVAVLWLLIWLSVASLAKDAHVYRIRVEQVLDAVALRIEPYLPGEKNAAPAKDAAGTPAAKAPAKTMDTTVDATVAPAHIDPAAEVAAAEVDALDAQLAKAEESIASHSPVAHVSAMRLKDMSLRAYSAARLQALVQTLSMSLFELMGNGVMIALFMFFMLTGSADSGAEGRRSRPQLWLEIEAQIREYIVMKTLISAGTGIAVWATLLFFGIPLATVFGLLAFMMNYIPNVGPMLMCVLPLPLIFLDPRLGLMSMLTVASLMFAIQVISGSIVEPKLMGSSFKLHPVTIMLTLLLWGVIWGIPGMFLSTPITAAMRIVLDKFETTRPLARLLAGQLGATEKSVPA